MKPQRIRKHGFNLQAKEIKIGGNRHESTGLGNCPWLRWVGGWEQSTNRKAEMEPVWIHVLINSKSLLL